MLVSGEPWLLCTTDPQMDSYWNDRRSFRARRGASTVFTGRVDLWKRWTTLTLMLVLRCLFVAGSRISVSDKMRFHLEPHNIIAVRNEAAILDCIVESSLPADIYWIKDGVTIQYDNRRYKLHNDSLHFTFIEHSSSHRPDEGLYQCAANIRTQGTIVSRKAKLQVAYMNGFVEEPKSQAVYLGDVVVLFCELDAFPRPTVHWYKDSRALNTSSSNHFVHSNNALELHNLQSSDFGQYQCRAVNEGGERFSRNAQLTRNTVASRQMNLPEFLAVPPKEVDVLEGETVVLFCAASGQNRNGGISRVEWLKDGSSFVITERQHGQLSRWSIEGQGSLRIDNVGVGDAGRYTCRAMASNASVDAHSTIRILGDSAYLI